ncbi:MAG TPA: hypothetical protein VGK74_02925 [Symbiobacteriaceae bacterium]|jgi:hypothetical protein
MPKPDLLPATLNRMERGIEAFERADALTRRLVLAQMLGTSAYVVEVTQEVSKDAALNIVLATLEAKVKPAPVPS